MTEARQIYRLSTVNVLEINRVFAQLSDRLDELEGRRGTPTFYSDIDMSSQKVTNTADGVNDSDAVTKGQIDNITAEQIDPIFPIGTIWFSTVDTNPGTFLPGVWNRFGSGRTIMGYDGTDEDYDTAEGTGGARLSYWSCTSNGGYVSTPLPMYDLDPEWNPNANVLKGVTTPYVTVYMWKRVS